MADQGKNKPIGSTWLNSTTIKKLFKALDPDGNELRIVGGAIRNHLLDLPVTDIDFASCMTPDKIIDRAQSANLKTIPTGIEHGTITVMVDSEPFEVTTLRSDVETDGRRAKVVFGTSWEEDAARRDFTVNALYATRDGQIYDPLGSGLEDIEKRVLRFIGDPSKRIKEDYLRILRYFRFCAVLNFGEFNQPAIDAAIAERGGLKTLSKERVKEELFKLISANEAPAVVEKMYSSGLLQELLEFVPNLAAFKRICELEETLNLTPNASLRLGCLTLWNAGDIDRMTHSLKLSKSEVETLRKMAINKRWRLEQDASDMQREHCRLGKETFLIKVLSAWALGQRSTTDPELKNLYVEAMEWEAIEFPLAGSDLLNEGLSEGPAIGEKLRNLKEKWLESDMQLSKSDLLSLAKNT